MQHKWFCTLTDDSELSISACNGSCILSQVNWAYKKLSQVFIYLVSTTRWPNIWRICKDECHRRILTTVSVYSMWNALTLDLHTIYNHYKLRSTTGPLAVLYQFSLLLYTPHKLLIVVTIHSSPFALCDQSDSSLAKTLWQNIQVPTLTTVLVPISPVTTYSQPWNQQRFTSYTSLWTLTDLQ